MLPDTELHRNFLSILFRWDQFDRLLNSEPTSSSTSNTPFYRHRNPLHFLSILLHVSLPRFNILLLGSYSKQSQMTDHEPSARSRSGGLGAAAHTGGKSLGVFRLQNLLPSRLAFYFNNNNA